MKLPFTGRWRLYMRERRRNIKVYISK